MLLLHKTSNVLFKYMGVITPQFSRDMYVELENIKTGKTERFLYRTYMQYFTIISD